MRQFYYSDHGYVEHDTWQPDCWVNVVDPTHDDIRYITHTLGVPEEYLDDLEDADERPRVEGDDTWMLTILRVPMKDNSGLQPYATVPIGIITGRGIILTVCYHRTEMLPDFVDHTRPGHRHTLPGGLHSAHHLQRDLLVPALPEGHEH